MVDFPRFGATASLLGLAALPGLGGCASANPEARGPFEQPGPASAPLPDRGDLAPAERTDAERWERWALAVGRLGLGVDQKLRTLGAVPGPFEPDEAAATAGAGNGQTGGGDSQGELARLLHERLVLAVAASWLEQAAACLVPPGRRTARRCGARGWGAAIEAGERLPALLEAADRHVTELREQAAAARAARDAERDSEQAMLARAIEAIGPAGLLKAADGGGKLAERPSRETSGEHKSKQKLEAPGPTPATPITSPCAPGDPLCGWGGEDQDDVAFLPTEGGRAMAPAAKPKPSTPAPPRPPTGVEAAVVAPASSVLDGVMPLVKVRLDDIGACLPDPTRSASAVRLEVKARVAADGSMRDVRVGPVAELPPAAASCIVAILQQLRTPAPSDGGSHVVSFPLWVAGGAP